MRRVVFGAVVVALLGSAPLAFAAPPDAAKVKLAAEQFDAAVAALRQKDFEGAASHFEAADAAAPSAQVLRQAIKARSEAGQGSRAATLAALALQRYPGDAATSRLAKDTIEKLSPLLAKVNVACASPCVLALDSRAVPGESSTRRVIYLDPGRATIGASFFGGTSLSRELTAVAGTTVELRLDPDDAATPAAPPKIAVAPVPEKTDDHEKPPEDAHHEDAPSSDEAKPSKGLPKAVFVVSAVTTAALGGVTIWSGVDTIGNPGVDAVRAACAGKGTSCALYQTGLGKQTRTDVFIGATAGVGAATIVIAIFTRWKSPPKSDAQASGFRSVTFGAAGPGLGVRGAF